MMHFSWQKIITLLIFTFLSTSECRSSSKGFENITGRQIHKQVGEFASCNDSEHEDGFLPCGTVEYLGCTGSKKLYHESAIKMNWQEAWEYCRSIGLHLATVESKYEQSFIELFLPSSGSQKTETYWLSGNDFVVEGQFMWMATGRLFTYDNFGYGEPNNRFGAENCVEMVILPGFKDYLWNDKNCLKRSYVLCQQDLRYPEKIFDASRIVHTHGQSHDNHGN